MNPIFTLNYPELAAAECLQKHFPKKDGYSVLIPLSGQQKGYDLALLKGNTDGKGEEQADQGLSPLGSKVATFQVKSSRAYPGTPGKAKLTNLEKFAHYLWLNTFAVPKEADFFLVHGLYAPNPLSSKAKASTWRTVMLLFTNPEMQSLMGGLVSRNGGKETHFGFGFNDEKAIFLTRGHALAEHPDVSPHLFANHHQVIEAAFA
ncbi:hypothetical protein [Azoarcus sp. KH32C]|uniref:hypothetical protein n=1 Tax=Azoarcus sp. KH32C TaxID=748247 RepID=UPI00023866E9|nr:hypothetical protein [Azoarcus sp. KH32C]BAL23683.1 hypothetical protein AZKH_1361 [Azoarcus sp. KH32C]